MLRDALFGAGAKYMLEYENGTMRRRSERRSIERACIETIWTSKIVLGMFLIS